MDCRNSEWRTVGDGLVREELIAAAVSGVLTTCRAPGEMLFMHYLTLLTYLMLQAL